MVCNGPQRCVTDHDGGASLRLRLDAGRRRRSVVARHAAPVGARVSREVLGRDEALAARAAHVLRLEDVDLRLGVPVEVRLRHALVAAQLAVELADTWRHRARRGVSGGRHQRGAASAGGGVSGGRRQRGAASAGGGVSGGRGSIPLRDRIFLPVPIPIPELESNWNCHHRNRNRRRNWILWDWIRNCCARN